jgi:Tol biopolymer transport system component
VAADGSGEPVQLTDGGAADDGDAVWSPDGERIAFRRITGSTADIYLMNADGSGVRPLLVSPGTDQDPTWSPDGARIAFQERSGRPLRSGREPRVGRVRRRDRTAPAPAGRGGGGRLRSRLGCPLSGQNLVVGCPVSSRRP